MRKIEILVINISLCLAVAFIFPHSGKSFPIEDDTICLVCHEDNSFPDGTIHTIHEGQLCNTCHDVVGDTPSSSMCIQCHPLGDPGQCQLVNFHDPGIGADCLVCHDCDGETTTTTTFPSGSKLNIGSQRANCGDVGVKIPICLVNLQDEIGAVQVDLCEEISICNDGERSSPLWQTISGDPQHTGQRAIDVQVNAPVQASWTFSLDQLDHPPTSPCPPPYTPEDDKEIIYSSSVVGDGKVFFGSQISCPVAFPGDGWFYALDQCTGELLWSQNMHGWTESSPALSNDNSIVYVGSKSSMLTAMDTQTGDKIWEFQTGGAITCSPTVDSEGTIYIGSLEGTLDGALYAVNPDGTQKWSYTVPSGGSVHSTPALSQDESTVYFGYSQVCGGPTNPGPCPPSPDFALLAVNTANGTLNWDFPVDGDIWGSPMVSPYDGSIVFVDFNDSGPSYVYSLSPAGLENWRYQMDNFSIGIPSIGPDGTVYVGDFIGGSDANSSLYAINSDGTLKWEFNTLTPNINYQSSVALINGGETVVFGTYTGEIYALDADDMSIQWSYFTGKMIQASVAVSSDGHIFFGDWNGVQYSIGGRETRISNDCLICTGCEMTERTTIFDCMVNELDNGCCALEVFSKNPGGVINPGEGDIVTIDYAFEDEPQCCNSCIEINAEHIEVVDQYGYLVDTVVGDVGMVCPVPEEGCMLEEIYGEDSEETELLRYIRDNILSPTPEGREIIRLYYEWNPVIVKAMEEDVAFKEQVKEMVDGVLELIR